MKTKKNLIKKIFTIILFINSLIIVAQESNQTNSAIKEWIIDDYITFSEKAVKDCYKLEINKIRLIDRIDLLLKNNKIDEKTHSENKKKIESEQDVLLNFYKGEIEFEISHIKKFCEKELANLYNTTQEKKTEYILQKIEQDFASYYNQEKKYLEINPIDKPKSVPNNGSDTSWSIDDYDKFVQNETDNCPNLLIQKKDNAKEKLDKGINKLKSDMF